MVPGVPRRGAARGGGTPGVQPGSGGCLQGRRAQGHPGAGAGRAAAARRRAQASRRAQRLGALGGGFP
eukprot:9069575-Pyramimonas_sp.AAC.1